MIITAIFARIADAYDAYKLKKAKFAEIQKEIEAGNALAVLQVLKDVTFDEAKNERILKAAILSDRVPVFDTVLNTLYKADVNKMVSHGDDKMPELGHGLGTRTILAYAIKNDCPDVALRLASDIKTDINKVGQTTYIEHHFMDARVKTCNHTMRVDDSALFMARAASMPAVTAVLSRRMNDLRRESVKKQEVESSRILPR